MKRKLYKMTGHRELLEASYALLERGKVICYCCFSTKAGHRLRLNAVYAPFVQEKGAFRGRYVARWGIDYICVLSMPILVPGVGIPTCTLFPGSNFRLSSYI